MKGICMMRNNRKSNNKLLGICTLFLILAVVLAGCGATNTAEGETTPAPTQSPDSTPVQPAPESPSPTPDQKPEVVSLHKVYANDFLIGNIYNVSVTGGPDKRVILTHFNALTPENLMKPGNIQPSEGNFKFGDSDKMMEFAEKNGLKVIGHTLAWHQQSGNFLGRNVTRDQAIEQLRTHINKVAGQYKGRILAWDVVNEAIEDGVTLPSDGDWTKCLRKTQWLESIGPEYLAMAFQFAREADPAAKLYYNDYNLNYKNKADIVYAMVKDLKEQGVPIDGIGEQAHYNTSVSTASVAYCLELFSKLDVEVSITELDVTVDGAAASGLTKEQEIEQAIVYAKLFTVFKDYSDVIERVTFWGYLDSMSWRKERFPCLFNGDYTEKEAFKAVLDPESYLKANGAEESAVPAKTAQAKFGTPVIDGKVDDIWASAPESEVSTRITAWEGATGTVKALWDEKFIYCLVEVEDDVLNKSSANKHEHDSVEIFLDQNNDKTPSYGPDDGQYRVNFKSESSFGTTPGTAGFMSGAARTPTGYLVEMAIPLVSAAKEGLILGFDAQINDANAEGLRQGIAKFSDPTDNSWSSAAAWGNLELVK